MKKLEIQIRSVERVLEDFRQAFGAAQEGMPFQKKEGVFFTSLEAARNLLTPERVKLLRLIHHRRPASLYELAKLTDRDLKNVHEDVELLERHGVLRTALRDEHERVRRVPEVDYDEILVHIPIAGVREPQGSESGTSYDFPDYESKRGRYKPEKVRWLFVAESPPADRTRYFYFENVKKADNLFLELMKSLYPAPYASTQELRSNKRLFLERFKSDGCYLIDAVEYPLGGLGPSGKVKRIKEGLPALVLRLRSLMIPETRIILISMPVFKACFSKLIEEKIPVANREPIDFPGQGRQRHFRRKLQLLLAHEGWQPDRS